LIVQLYKVYIENLSY